MVYEFKDKVLVVMVLGGSLFGVVGMLVLDDVIEVFIVLLVVVKFVLKVVEGNVVV